MISATGKVKRSVTCESCRHSYEYEMCRTAYGTFSGFTVTRAEADAKEAEDAQERLSAMLASECDIIPCPKCGALTREMREAKANIIPQCIGGVLLGAAIALGVYFIGREMGLWYFVLGLLGIGLTLISALVLVITIFDVAGGHGPHGWQSKVKPRTARGIAYALMGMGFILLLASFVAGYAALAGGGVTILFGVAVHIAAQSRKPGNSDPSQNAQNAEGQSWESPGASPRLNE